MAAFKEFKRALIEMKNNGELDKILNASKDKKTVEHDIDIIDQLAELRAENVSAIPVIMELQSVEIFKDALCFMNNSEEV